MQISSHLLAAVSLAGSKHGEVDFVKKSGRGGA
jgi:hypothetical protein